MKENQLICLDCQKVFVEDIKAKYCICGGILIIKTRKNVFNQDWIDENNRSMWKFDRVLSVQGVLKEWENVSLGEGNTVLEKLDTDNEHIYLKLEYNSPSKSYIDRSSALLVTKLKEREITKIIFTTANYMILSIAKYAKQATIPCELFLSEIGSSKLIKGLKDTGVIINHSVNQQEIPKDNGFFIVTDNHPYLIEGAKTFAYEIWDQLGRCEPDFVVFSIESSILSMGAYYGFLDLLEQGLIEKLPAFIIVDILLSSKSEYASTSPSYKEVKKIIKKTDGHMQTITHTEVVQAKKALLIRGHQVDNQSAAAYAGSMRYYRDHSIKNETFVIPLSHVSATGKRL